VKGSFEKLPFTSDERGGMARFGSTVRVEVDGEEKVTKDEKRFIYGQERQAIEIKTRREGG
jgi:hypothetical protein